MGVTEEEIRLSSELDDIGEDLEGVRHVQQVYGTMPSDNYKIFVLVDRNNLDNLIQQIKSIKDNLKPTDNGKNQVVMMVNNANQNPLVYMASEMKDVVIDGFKATLPSLDNSLEQAWNAKKAELDAAANG